LPADPAEWFGRGEPGRRTSGDGIRYAAFWDRLRVLAPVRSAGKA